MGRANTENGESTYYPPRARWYGRALYPWFRLQHRLQLEKIQLPGKVSVTEFLLSLVIPGFSLVVDGRKILGMCFFAGWCVSVLVTFAALGYSVANVAGVIAVTVHGLSVFYLHRPRMQDFGFGLKLCMAFFFVLLVGLLGYVPTAYYCGRHWMMPLRVKGQVVVIDTRIAARSFENDDWMAYNIPNYFGAHGVYVMNGIGLSRVLAVGGERVTFEEGTYRVDGVPHPSLPHMPTSGEVVISENHWFVWPDLAIRGRGNPGESVVSGMLLQVAVISREQVVGKPFKRWFWRRQISS